jgi:hypothetical protein
MTPSSSEMIHELHNELIKNERERKNVETEMAARCCCWRKKRGNDKNIYIHENEIIVPEFSLSFIIE